MTATRTDTFVRDWHEWHRHHEERRADQHGFLAITDLHWLSDRPQSFPDAPGAWSSDERGVVVDLGAAQILVDGERVSGRHEFGVLAERQSRYVDWGDAVIEVAKRGGYDIIRPRHPDNPLRLAYAGTPTYDPDPKWLTSGRFRAFDRPRPTTVGAAVDGLQHVYDAPGEITFRLAGKDLRVTAFPGSGSNLMVLFTDRTSGVSTYAANRVLAVDRPADDGSLTLDFNRAVNLPCAYTPLATCPLPPPENRLPIAVEAGERTPGPALPSP